MKGKIIFVVIILAFLGSAFYWFQWRPSQIRNKCNKDALEASLIICEIN